MYDQHSAGLLHSTDSRSLGALWNPGPTVRQWGPPPNDVELAALGRARLAASVQVNAADVFWQHHPHDQTAFILCAARVSSVEPGWEIVLLDEEQRPFWHLKADRGAELHCVDHCGGWQPGCRGVVSVPSGGRREPPAPPPTVGMGEPSPMPRPAPAAPVRSSWRDRRRERVAQHMGFASAEPQRQATAMHWPTASAPVEAEQQHAGDALPVYEGLRWPGEADRGEIHAQHYVEPQPAPAVEQSAPQRRGFFAALFGGAAAVPAVVETVAPSVPATWNWPEPAGGGGEEYRGELHTPQPPAWQWPDAPQVEHSCGAWDAPQVEHQPGAWNAPALGEPDEAHALDAWPAYEALPAPDDAGRLSSQVEIDSFIDASWETVPASEPVAEIEAPALMLPPPDEPDRE